MGLDPREVRDLIVRPTLEILQLPNPLVSERLIMGTAAQESGFGHIKQVGGPALGLWQMEPATFNDLFYGFLRSSKQASLRLRLQNFILDGAESLRRIEPADQLKGNLYFSAAMCRIHYYAKPFTMPVNASAAELATIWKRWYNSMLGAGTEVQFIANYAKYVAPLY